VVELHDSLGDVERVVIGQRYDTGPEPNGVRGLAGGGQEHLRRGDNLPPARVVLAAPELVVAEPVEVRRKVQIALELKCRILAERVVGGQECAELEPR